ncbi:N-terminal nucleophile aminohydrolase [Mycena olivaceomarginata]|nr:N-terminal nucleophile aminohydrolase [Mycena olivaceomarginata]
MAETIVRDNWQGLCDHRRRHNLRPLNHKMKTDEDKIKNLSPHLLMAYSGEPGDTVQFRRVRRAQHPPLPNPQHLRAAPVRRRILDPPRPRHLPAHPQSLLRKPPRRRLRHRVLRPPPLLDRPLGTMTEVPFAAHGYGAYFALSLLDRYHDPEAPLEEGLATLRRCIDEVSKRLVKSWTRTGSREVEL